MNIITKQDLSNYGIALVNNGITTGQIEILERGFMVMLFGVEGARNIYNLLIDEESKQVSTSELQNLLHGDGILFPGLIALLSLLCCMHLISKSRLEVGRVNGSRRPADSATLSKQDENEVIQALAWEITHVVFALKDFLKVADNNKLGLEIVYTPVLNTYAKNLSGKIPVNGPKIGMNFNI